MYAHDAMHHENWITDEVYEKKKIDIKVETTCIKFYTLWFGKI